MATSGRINGYGAQRCSVPFSGWGYGPSGIVGVILIVVLILALTGRV